MHDEIQTCVTEIDKTKKLYFEEEHMAHDARDKAHDADEKWDFFFACVLNLPLKLYIYIITLYMNVIFISVFIDFLLV